MHDPSDADAQIVLRRFRVAPTAVENLGNSGGFSGAMIWRISDSRGSWCLKAWPEHAMSPSRHREIAHLMHCECIAGLKCIPTLAIADTGLPHVEHGGRLWELATWMSGRADFHAQPSDARLTSATSALAQLHQAWAQFEQPAQPCPAVSRRLAVAHDWLELLDSGWRPAITAADPVSPWSERAWRLVHQHVATIPQQLGPWIVVPFPIQPCLCDIWHDHVLFTGEAVTGLIDFGSARLDCIVTDLARLLGSFVANDERQYAFGLDVYSQTRPLTQQQRQLVRVLDRTAAVLGLTNWLRWLYLEKRQFEKRSKVAERMAVLVRRIEAW